jgi:S1-C subfamily serine protease
MASEMASDTVHDATLAPGVGRRRSSIRTFSLGALVGLGLMAGLVTAGCVDDGAATATATQDSTSTQTVANDPSQGSGSTVVVQAPQDFADVVDRALDSVAYIEGAARGGVSGSGMVLDKDGHILTNYHVVEGQTELKVVLANGDAATAVIVGSDPANDLAVIRATGFDAAELVPVRFGDSDAVRAGEAVFAIGNPFGQRFSVSSGIISATGRHTRSSFTGRAIRDVIQTDAALNRGNSGGPLFNLAGEVIGINTSIENPDGQVFVGLGFAVPSNTAVAFLPQLLAGEDIQHPQLGVGIEELDAVNAAGFGVSATSGLYVTSVTPSSAAERAGVRTGDVIRSVNGQSTTSFVDLARAIDTAAVGDFVTIILERSGEEMALTATLQPWDLSQ